MTEPIGLLAVVRPCRIETVPKKLFRRSHSVILAGEGICGDPDDEDRSRACGCLSPADGTEDNVGFDRSVTNAFARFKPCEEVPLFDDLAETAGNERQMIPNAFNIRWIALILLVIPALAFGENETESTDAVAESLPADATLESAVSLSESMSPILFKASADVEAARGRAIQAGLYPNPIAQGGATQLAGNESQYYFALSQEIVTKHKLHLSQAAACREVYQAEFHFVRSRYGLLTAVRQSFFIALASQRRVEVLTKLVEIAKKSADAAERMRAAGVTSRVDSLLFEIELEKAEVALENASSQLIAAHKQLAAVIGVRDMNIERLRGNLKVSLRESIDQILVDGYIPYNADVQVAEQEVERTRVLLKRAQVDPFPNVTVYGGYQYQVVPIHNMGLISASVPLPLWNRNQGNIATAHANIQKATADVNQVQNQIARQMAEMTGRYQVADQQARRFEEKIIPKAREGVTIIQEAFANGQLDSFQLLQSQRGLVESNLGYIAALEARWLAAAELAGLAQLESFP